MSSVKRKALESSLQRRVRARRDASEEPQELSESSDQDDGASGSEDGVDENLANNNESDDSGDAEDSESEGSEPGEAASISFGALAKAQESIQRSAKGKPGKETKRPKKVSDDPWENNEAAERKAGRKDHRDFSRSNKNAPTEISSKKAVSRKRDVVPVIKRDYRDPRFDPSVGQVDDTKVNKAYSFLNDYRQDEVKALKEQIKKSKDEHEKEKMKRTLHSLESKVKAAARKAKESEILDKHRKEEKQLVKEGKTPFYLKKAEQKKQFIMEQYSSLKGKQLDHVIERRRKKVEGKEKKNLPYARRDFGGDN
ncbi:rRNA bioproteinsis protein rrp36 [Pseudogymnoascus verrucosus]|uniref:rRNA biogenesis protein RRP36 n=1 Tax=Pseudogymnoascus verrucosus TaxID=342668 RepID=A0A1B8GNT4_9PEZI|nr:rRNA biogenesis protein rrp36 [Pseudogymnoascus verrucosus]OBT97467.1 rRNA bioproteinsis protein rrp36 [Pseudogymnoascus verrucosus]